MLQNDERARSRQSASQSKFKSGVSAECATQFFRFKAFSIAHSNERNGLLRELVQNYPVAQAELLTPEEIGALEALVTLRDGPEARSLIQKATARFEKELYSFIENLFVSCNGKLELYASLRQAWPLYCIMCPLSRRFPSRNSLPFRDVSPIRSQGRVTFTTLNRLSSQPCTTQELKLRFQLQKNTQQLRGLLNRLVCRICLTKQSIWNFIDHSNICYEFQSNKRLLQDVTIVLFKMIEEFETSTADLNLRISPNMAINLERDLFSESRAENLIIQYKKSQLSVASGKSREFSPRRFKKDESSPGSRKLQTMNGLGQPDNESDILKKELQRKSQPSAQNAKNPHYLRRLAHRNNREKEANNDPFAELIEVTRPRNNVFSDAAQKKGSYDFQDKVPSFSFDSLDDPRSSDQHTGNRLVSPEFIKKSSLDFGVDGLKEEGDNQDLPGDIFFNTHAEPAFDRRNSFDNEEGEKMDSDCEDGVESPKKFSGSCLEPLDIIAEEEENQQQQSKKKVDKPVSKSSRLHIFEINGPDRFVETKAIDKQTSSEGSFDDEFGKELTDEAGNVIGSKVLGMGLDSSSRFLPLDSRFPSVRMIREKTALQSAKQVVVSMRNLGVPSHRQVDPAEPQRPAPANNTQSPGQYQITVAQSSDPEWGAVQEPDSHHDLNETSTPEGKNSKDSKVSNASRFKRPFVGFQQGLSKDGVPAYVQPLTAARTASNPNNNQEPALIAFLSKPLNPETNVFNFDGQSPENKSFNDSNNPGLKADSLVNSSISKDDLNSKSNVGGNRKAGSMIDCKPPRSNPKKECGHIEIGLLMTQQPIKSNSNNFGEQFTLTNSMSKQLTLGNSTSKQVNTKTSPLAIDKSGKSGFFPVCSTDWRGAITQNESRQQTKAQMPFEVRRKIWAQANKAATEYKKEKRKKEQSEDQLMLVLYRRLQEYKDRLHRSNYNVNYIFEKDLIFELGAIRSRFESDVYKRFIDRFLDSLKLRMELIQRQCKGESAINGLEKDNNRRRLLKNKVSVSFSNLRSVDRASRKYLKPFAAFGFDRKAKESGKTPVNQNVDCSSGLKFPVKTADQTDGGKAAGLFGKGTQKPGEEGKKEDANVNPNTSLDDLVSGIELSDGERKEEEDKNAEAGLAAQFKNDLGPSADKHAPTFPILMNRDIAPREPRSTLSPPRIRKHPSDSKIVFVAEREKLFNELTKEVSLADFDFIKEIGKGAYGKVFLAQQKNTKDIFALKLIQFQDKVTKKVLKDLQNEISVLNVITGEFLAKAYFSFVDRHCLCIAMEYMVGGDFRSLLENEGRLDEKTSQWYIAQLIVAVEELHAKNIVHRDLKPENLLLNKDLKLQLADFGLSEFRRQVDISGQLGEEANVVDPKIKKLSGGKNKDKVIIGTADYIPPEVIIAAEANSDKRVKVEKPGDNPKTVNPDTSGVSPAKFDFQDAIKQLDDIYVDSHYLIDIYPTPRQESLIKPIDESASAIDWWGVGCLLYEFLVGTSAFGGSTIMEVYDNIKEFRIVWPDIGYEDGEISPEAQDLILKFLDRDPTKRLGVRSIDDIISHPFFKDFDWKNLGKGPAPISLEMKLPCPNKKIKMSTVAPLKQGLAPIKLESKELVISRLDLLFELNMKLIMDLR